MSRLFPRNVLIHDGERLEGVEFKGEWIAVPMEDYRVATKAPTPPDALLDPEDYDIGDNGAIIPRAPTPPDALDVERLALALRAWRGDYGAPLAADLPDAADLARCYAEAVKSDKPRTFDQYVRPEPKS